MLNISIKHLQKALNTDAKKKAFMQKYVIIQEKYDGIKVSLIRNDQPYDESDYKNNWIVSYKGNVLYPGEYVGFDWWYIDSEVRRWSIGTSQFAFVHNLLEMNNHRYKDIPVNTEFFVEFVQQKPTLTRDYEEFHQMFLIGYAPTEYLLYDQRVVTTASQIETKMLKSYSDQLRIPLPEVLYDGIASKLGTFDEILAKYSDFQSSLGGQAEGVVIKTSDGEIYKIVAADQYDKNVRKDKKSRWALGDEDEKQYWKVINDCAIKTLDKIPNNLSTNLFLSELSSIVYTSEISKIPAKNPKKHTINILDDLFLTAKLRWERYKKFDEKTEKIGVYVMSGKPVHSGHWGMIALASMENDVVFLYISTKDRKDEMGINVSGETMLKIWKNYLFKHLSKNVVVRFCDSPYIDALHEIKTLQSEQEKFTFSLYTGENDSEACWDSEKLDKMFPDLLERHGLFLCEEDRASIVNINGKTMRHFLQSDQKLSFVQYLPNCVRFDGNAIWDLLRAGMK